MTVASTTGTTTTAGLTTTPNVTANTSPSGTSSGGALGTLAGNFTDFLKLLMTQLQNQDPTAPMDTNQFTSQLVQFTSVEQQITTNSSLNTLIQATQGNTLLQSTALVGKPVEVTSDQLSLQGGTAGVNFKTSTAQPVSISISNQAGIKLRQIDLTSAPGTNKYTWDGKDSNGRPMADGAYKVAVATTGGTLVPFTVRGTATSVQRTGTAMTVQLGTLGVDFSAVQSVGAQ